MICVEGWNFGGFFDRERQELLESRLMEGPGRGRVGRKL